MDTIVKVLNHEFKMYIRDRKLIANTLLFPVLIYPVIIAIIAMGIFISMRSEAGGIKVSIQGKNPEIVDALKKTEGLKIITDKIYTDEDLLSRKVDAILLVSEDKNQTIKIKYDSTKRSFSLGKVSSSIEKLRRNYITTVLEEKGLKYEDINPVSLRELNEKGKGIDEFTVISSILLPMLFLLFPLISTSYLTTDIAAGEKEKMTLEPLLCTKSARYKILLGKVFFTSIVSVMISFISVFVLGLTIIAAISSFKLPIAAIHVSVLGMLLAFIVLMLTVIFLSALQLALSFFAKNYKESQLLLSPLLILIMIPIFMSFLIPDRPTFYHLPLFNVVLLLKQLIAGSINILNISIVLGWLFVYISISLGFSILAINNEKFIFRI